MEKENYYQLNKDKITTYISKNREKIKKYNHQYYLDHKEKLKALNTQYRLAHPEKFNTKRVKKYYHNDDEKREARKRNYRLKKERRAEYIKKIDEKIGKVIPDQYFSINKVDKLIDFDL